MTTLKVLHRLIALDIKLAGLHGPDDQGHSGLWVPTFAKEWNVDQRTIKRDLAALRALGLEIEWKRGRLAELEQESHLGPNR